MLSGQIADGFTTIFAGELVFLRLNLAYYFTSIISLVPVAHLLASTYLHYFSYASIIFLIYSF